MTDLIRLDRLTRGYAMGTEAVRALRGVTLRDGLVHSDESRRAA